MKGKKKFSHKTAIIEEGAKIGENTKIWHHTHVREGGKIGSNCNIGKNCYIDKGAIVGNNVKIQNNVSVWHGVVIEDDVFVGPNVVFTNDLYPRAFIWDKERLQKTLIKKGASLGANSTIICGNRVIGEYALVGAGAVVTKDVPPHGLVIGNPARLVGFVCKCGYPLKEKIGEEDHFVIMKCDHCNSTIKINKEDFGKVRK